jgi:hypothetical protein
VSLQIRSASRVLLCCAYRLASRTLRMSALAAARQVIDGHSLAVGAAIFAALWYRALATRMGTFVGFLFGHDSLPLVFTVPA